MHESPSSPALLGARQHQNLPQPIAVQHASANQLVAAAALKEHCKESRLAVGLSIVCGGARRRLLGPQVLLTKHKAATVEFPVGALCEGGNGDGQERRRNVIVQAHPLGLCQLVGIQGDHVRFGSEAHEHVDVALPEAPAVSVAQADHAVELGLDSALFEHFPRHRRGKILAGVRQPTRQLEGSLHSWARGDALLDHQHLAILVEHHTADADHRECEARQGARSGWQPARQLEVFWCGVVEGESKGDRCTNVPMAFGGQFQPDAALTIRHPAL